MISIDLGSNTFRCIEYACERREWGREFERIVKTADNMHLSGKINAEALERVIKAITEAQAMMDFTTQPVRAVTTAAMRMASNAAEVLAEIEARTGILFEIIDADREAYYTALAVKSRLEALHIDAQSFVLIDIGGGSSEVIFVNAEKRESQSFPVGIVTLAQQCASPSEVRSRLQEMLIPVRRYIDEVYAKSGKPHTLIATAGTPTTIAAFMQGMTYESYDARAINGYVLSLDECGEALEKLLALDETTRAKYVGVGRETLIVAGVVIVEEFYKLLGFESAIVVDDGVREGVAIDYCASSVR